MKDHIREDILSAFNSLVETTDFDKITVQMICEQAEVGRTTFYRHFKDKYDVMNYNYMQYFQEYLITGKINTFEDFFNIMTAEGTDYFRHIKKIFESTGVNSFRNYLYETSFMAVQLVFKAKGKDHLTPAETLQYQYLCHGIPFLYESWIKGEHPDLTSEEAAHAIYEILPPAMQGNLWE